MRPRCSAFTLIEVLLVMAIIGMLSSILLPAISVGRQMAWDVSCKSLLKQYAYATQMYSSQHQGMMPDSYHWLDYSRGLPRYFSSSHIDNLGRCPGSGPTEGLNRSGKFMAEDMNGEYVEVTVTIGASENSLSASERPTSGGPKAFWVNDADIPGDHSKVMTWADWQNNPYKEAPTVAVVKPGGVSAMGSLCFRHLGHSNAAFLDGHVGELVPLIEIAEDGHELGPGATWGAEGSGQAYKCYYPFGPGQTPAGWTIKGYFPTIKIQ